MSNVKSLSVFSPLFNEEGNVQRQVENTLKVLEGLKIKDYEIILINDGSTDNTAKVVDQLASSNKKIRAIHHQQNLGYGEALKSGFYNAKYDTIVYTDGDGQFDFSEVTKFLDKIEDNDLLIGYRIKRQDPLFRILFKKGWTFSLFLMYGLTLKDVDCGFKMIKRQVLEKIPKLESSRGAMINAEIAIKAKKYGFKVGQVGVNHYPRLSGKPTGASLKVIIQSYLDLLRLWWKLKDQKILFLALLATLILAACLRLHKIDQYMIFLGDEGRDAIIVKEMFTKHHFPAIGPPTSVGDIYLGPLYYYMMFIPMVLTNFNPVSASVMVALIGVATVFLIYYLGKVWFSRWGGLIAAFLYAISPITINYANFSWNPNPTPFFALIGILGFHKLNKTGNFRWLILTGAATAAALQMHYLSLILIPIFGILWVHEVLIRKSKKQPLKKLLSGTIWGILIFLLIMSPLFLFDLRHDFLNYKAITKLLTQGGAVRADLFSNISRIPGIYSNNLIGRYMAGENPILSAIVSILILLPLIKFRIHWPLLALGVWLLVGLFGLSFYQADIYDHYLGFMNPVSFLLLGSLASFKFGGNLKNILLIILVLALTYVNLSKNPLLYPPNNQLKRTQETAKFIIEKARAQDFNFALLSKNNYDSAYQFYLEGYGHKLKVVPFEKTGQLFVVCEDQVCDPTHNAKYEIAGYGWSKIDWMQEVNGVKVYRLIPNPSGKPS